MDALEIINTYARSKGYAGTAKHDLVRFIKREAKAAGRRAEEASEKEATE